jgi:hypothetical protein
VTERSVAALLEGIDNYEKLLYEDIFFSPSKKEEAECFARAIEANPLAIDQFIFDEITEPDLDKIAEDREEQKQEQMSEEEYNDLKKVKEAEEFESNK